MKTRVNFASVIEPLLRPYKDGEIPYEEEETTKPFEVNVLYPGGGGHLIFTCDKIDMTAVGMRFSYDRNNNIIMIHPSQCLRIEISEVEDD